ncbi:amino acid ABC transporter substrate-binding protein [Intrasporangium chromatireducens]|nr:amino acid ABC transporter substrate-binding protein [Intrasporangium chromatireducens]
MTELNRRHFLTGAGLALGGAVLAPSLAACGGGGGGGGGSSSGKFKIGAVLELSGADATGGQIAQRGYQFWVDTVNKAGGIAVGGKKYPVELVVQDCQSQPGNATTAVSKLATQDKVDAMFGSYTSGVQIAMNPICEKYQIPCLAGSAESPKTWSTQPKYAYGIIPSVDTTAGKAIELIKQLGSPAPGTIAAVGVNEPFSDATQKGFENGGTAAGLQVVYSTLFPANADLTPVANAIKAKAPDIVAVGGHDVLLVDFVKALQSVGFTPKAVIEHYGITDASFAKALGAKANGVLGIAVWLPDSPTQDDVFGKASEYASGFHAKYGSDPDYTAAGCSAAGVVLQKALEKLGAAPGMDEAQRGKLNDTIAATDIDCFYGKIKFEASGDHFHDNTALTPILVQIQNGEVVAVGPQDKAKAKMIYPLPSLS